MSVPALLDSFAATATGFRCVCHGQPHKFLDDDVVGLRVQASCIAGANGRARNQERLSIRVADPSIPVIEVDTEFTGPDDNFLAAFHQRLLANLSLRAVSTLLEEGQFDGGPWLLGLDGLRDKHSGQQIALDEISRIAWQDRQCCFWRKGSDQWAIRFACDEENTNLLAQMTSQLLRIDLDECPEGQSDCGRFEFRDTRLHVQIALGAIGGACLAAAVVAVKLALAGQMAMAALVGAASVAMLISLGLGYWKFGTPDILRLSNDVLSLVRGGRGTSLPLSDLATISAQWIDYYRQGVYQQSHVHFQFTTDESFTLTYDSQASFGTSKFDELQQFQAHLASRIAPRLRSELKATGRVVWTGRITILRDGIEFTKRSGAEPRLIAFSQITHCEVDQGLLKLAFDGSPKPNIVEQTKQPNFYPGLVLFNELWADRCT
jgi:hypothetical protein